MKRPVPLFVGLSLIIVASVLLFRVFMISLILPPRYVSTARVIPPQSAFTSPEREVQIILATRTLYPVITNLGLNKILADQLRSEEPLPTEVTLALLKRNLEVSLEPKARILRIQASSEDRVQAMTVANEIAKVYLANLSAAQDQSSTGASILEAATVSIRPFRPPGRFVGVVLLLLVELTGCVFLIAAFRR